tara:strand:- start:1942 stop:2775 length:834 start_codon:yes stop_codon:yes gene_type:complete
MSKNEENIPGLRKIHFEPSTLEDIDRSVYNFVKDLNLSVNTNKGNKLVPVLWATSERSFLSKNNKEIRDGQGALVFPIISIKRNSFTKSLRSSGVYQGNIPEVDDEKGGALSIIRKIYQDKTKNFANADSKRLYGQENYRFDNQKVIFQTISIPMPVNVDLMYEITIRTDYQQQMNHLVLPFATRPGTINYVKLESGEHKYEGFIQDQYQSQDNLSNFSGEERKFEIKINLKVVGYLVGQAHNREKNFFTIRENFVEVKLPKETVITDPEELSKYGL